MTSLLLAAAVGLPILIFLLFRTTQPGHDAPNYSGGAILDFEENEPG
jgi:hypothetical protein